VTYYFETYFPELTEWWNKNSLHSLFKMYCWSASDLAIYYSTNICNTLFSQTFSCWTV